MAGLTTCSNHSCMPISQLLTLIASTLLASLFAMGCGNKGDEKVKKGQVTDEVTLQTPGYFVLSNRNEFMAVGIKSGANGYMTLSLAKSNDGENWVETEEGLKAVRGQQSIKFNSDSIEIFSTDEKQATALVSIFDAPNTAIATVENVDIMMTNSFKLIQLSNLNFYIVGAGRLEEAIKQEVKDLR